MTLELENTKMAMNDIPSRQEISGLGLQVRKCFLSTEAHVEEMTRDDKRQLQENVFVHRKAYREGGVGVFVRKQGSRKWAYEIRGTIFPELNWILSTDKTLGNYNYSVCDRIREMRRSLP